MKLFTRLSVVALICLSSAAMAQAPAGYPSDYAAIIAAAQKEAKVAIYGSTDTAAASPLIKDFQALYPGVTVEYNDMNTTELYNRLISEKAAGGGSVEFLHGLAGKAG